LVLTRGGFDRRRGPRLPGLGGTVLLLAALVSVAGFEAIPRDGFHPLALMACMLPLQLAALVYAVRGRRCAGSRGAVRRRRDLADGG